eukprot:GO256258.1.p1 GENE.GO256258.1~~GO256258.1.p1  ORF type:complete len:110 (+),score=1.24 GO256258.1:31-330(+)
MYFIILIALLSTSALSVTVPQTTTKVEPARFIHFWDIAADVTAYYHKYSQATLTSYCKWYLLSCTARPDPSVHSCRLCAITCTASRNFGDAASCGKDSI